MKVLQVQRVVPNLIPPTCGEILFTHFELNDENHVVKQHDGIYPFTESRNGVLKINPAAVAVRIQHTLKKFGLCNPSVALSCLNRKGTASRESAKNFVG